MHVSGILFECKMFMLIYIMHADINGVLMSVSFLLLLRFSVKIFTITFNLEI